MGKRFLSSVLCTLVVLLCWPIAIQSAPRLEEEPAVAVARAALDRALADHEALATKASSRAVDWAREDYHAAVAEHGEKILAHYGKLEASLGAAFLEGPEVLQDPELAGPVRDYRALRALQAEAEALFVPFASGTESEPNGTAATADAVAALDPCSVMAGAAAPTGDIDYFSFSAAAGDRLWAVVDTGSPPSAPGNSSRDSLFTLYAPGGTTVLEVDDDDASGNGGDGVVETIRASAIAGPTLAASGTYFLRIKEYEDLFTVDPYRLHAVLTKASHQTAEVEPNGTAATANRIIPPGQRIGVRTATMSDVDFYSVRANAGDRLLLVADGDPERDGVSTFVHFQLLAPDGVTVLVTASTSQNNSAFKAEGLVFNITAAGTYYVRVYPAPVFGTGTYHMMASNCTSSFPCVVNADCGDGNVCTNDVCNVGGSCSNPLVDTDGDGVCNALDCAPSNSTAFALPGEVAITAVQKTSATTANYVHANAGGGSGTVYDAVWDLLSRLPVGPGGGGELSFCGDTDLTMTVSGNPPVNAGYWFVIRGQNACGRGSYGNTHTNPGPPLNGPPRTTTTCP
jgi:hypothetical protein